jgi:hypothetical protein
MPVLEYLYSRIAAKAGMDVLRIDLISDGIDRHFLIERFDRVIRNGTLDKLHYASWSELDHGAIDDLRGDEDRLKDRPCGEIVPCFSHSRFSFQTYIHAYMYNSVMRIGMDRRTRVLEHHGLSGSDRR